MVPKVLSPSPDMSYVDPDSHTDEDKFQEMLIQPLETFLCNGNPDDEFQVGFAFPEKKELFFIIF